MYFSWRRWWLLLLILPFTFVSARSSLDQARLAQHTDKTRLVLQFSKKPRYRSFTLKKPPRLVLDLYSTVQRSSIHRLKVAGTVIKDIRVSQHRKGFLRVVFDLKAKLNKTNVFWLKRTSRHEGRLVLDFPKPGVSLVKQEQTTQPPKHSRKIATTRQHSPKPVIQLPWNKKARDVIVVIDPGHGGKDPGATGPRGIHEKNVVLSISRDLYALIKKQPGMKAYMTRTGDYYLTLRQRLQFARRHKADIFVAIHADAYRNHRAHGSSVYALSQRGATSEAARWLAEKENYSELGGVDLGDKSNLLRSVLIDLSQTATIGASLQLGSDVLHALGRMAHLHKRKVEQARFVVLKSPDIPSILIETGFISNPYEERLLRSSSYQHKLARAIMSGLKGYFWSHAPPGTWFAQQRRSRRYTVRRGQSLSAIAERFGTSVSALKSYNELRSSRLLVGQVLRIPPRGMS